MSPENKLDIKVSKESLSVRFPRLRRRVQILDMCVSPAAWVDLIFSVPDSRAGKVGKHSRPVLTLKTGLKSILSLFGDAGAVRKYTKLSLL